MVEEAASATEELSAQTRELNTTMKFFKIHEDGIRLPEKPENTKEKKVTESADDKTEVHESFSDLVDEGEFDEF